MSPRPLLALAFALGAFGGCFLSPNIPPSFRYDCTTDADCRVLNCRGDLVKIADADAGGLILAEDCDDLAEGEDTKFYEARQVCMGGLCEFPCELTTDACPAEKGYNLCFNGACATRCGNDLERFPDPGATCSNPQDCLIFGEDIEIALIEDLLGGGSSNPMQQGSGQSVAESLAGTGICGVRCDAEGALPCPPGNYCSGAMCLPGCDHEDAVACRDGEQCYSTGDFSLCIKTCDSTQDPSTCPEGEICVMGLNVCLPTCLGENPTLCSDGNVCDQTLGICIPEELGTDSGTDETETDAGTSAGSSGSSG